MPSLKGTSILSYYIGNHRVVFCLFDIETAGGYCGLVQLSAQVFRFSNFVKSIHDFIPTFDVQDQWLKYTLWGDNITYVHGLHANSDAIKAVKEINHVT